MEPAAQSRFEEATRLFYELEDTSVEWDLFANLGTCNKKRRDSRRLVQYRDRSFSYILWLYRYMNWHSPLHRKGQKKPIRRKPTVDLWYSRFDEWRRHLDVYFSLQGEQNDSPVAYGTKRIELLMTYFGTLDTKFSMLLGVNSVMLASFGVALNRMPNLLAVPDFQHWTNHKAAYFSEYLARTFLDAALMFVILCCLFNIWHVLRGFRRIVWGDLNKFEGDFAQGEDKHVNMLIVSVARRTNLFRIVAEVTRFVYQGFVIFALLAFFILSAHYLSDLLKGQI